MVTTRSKNSGQTVNSGVSGAADLVTTAKVGNANQGVVSLENISTKGDVASIQQQYQENLSSAIRIRLGAAMMHNTGEKQPERLVRTAQIQDVKRLARKLKPSHNSGSGMVVENDLLDFSSSNHSQIPMKRYSARVQALASGGCQGDQKQVPSSLDRSLENGQKVRFARRSNTDFNVSNHEGTVGNLQKANQKHQKKKRKTTNVVAEGSFTKLRRLVKQLIYRMKMEQNLIEAYSGEGWKGLSREKIRPEKELKRAEAQILKCKFAIREVIRDLCLKCSEGSILDSAFDSEGQIQVDEIFCAKCLSPQEFPDNDIILCDGSCNRAFHQKCLEPPLAIHDIPPDDEGWLCPVCDCKLDCLYLINDFIEKDFELETSWEEVFPEAAPTIHPSSEARGDWPSDDSEDDDYDPDQLDERNIKIEDDDQQDSEDSSGCSSSSSDLSGSEEQSQDKFEDEEAILSEDKRTPVCSTQKKWQKIAASDVDDLENSNLIVSDRRQRIEVDYKKLNDEMFGKDDSNDDESSDDEWGPQKRSKQKCQVSQTDMSSIQIPSSISGSTGLIIKTGKQSKLASQRRKASVESKREKLESQQTSIQNLCEKEELDKDENLNGQELVSPKIRKQKGIKLQSSDDLSIRSNKNLDDSAKVGMPSESGFRSRKVSADTKKDEKATAKHRPVKTMEKSSKNIIPEMAAQRLKGAFAENNLPTKSFKEDLSKELGLSYERVTLWFKNQRKNMASKKRRALASSQELSGASTAISLEKKAINLKDQLMLPSVLAESCNVEKHVEDH